MTDRDRQRDRLIELILNRERVDLPLPIEYQKDLADYLLANGVIVPPCKVGDKVYYIINNTIQELKVSVINIHENNYIAAKAICLDEFDMCDCNCDCAKKTCSVWFDYKSLGKTVFLTKEEAERELEKRGKENA